MALTNAQIIFNYRDVDSANDKRFAKRAESYLKKLDHKKSKSLMNRTTKAGYYKTTKKFNFKDPNENNDSFFITGGIADHAGMDETSEISRAKPRDFRLDKVSILYICYLHA